MLQVPSAENGTLVKGRVQQPVLERINVAHDFASAELLNLIIHKVLHSYCKLHELSEAS